MKVNHKVSPEDIDKLLNSFLDGELPPRQLAEVERLLASNKQLAHRLNQLRKCRTLLQLVPYNGAPAGLLADIHTMVEARAEQNRRIAAVVAPRGFRHLLARKALAAAAMFVLIAVLATVIYNILSPQTGVQPPMVTLPPTTSQTTNSADTPAKADFACRLELATGAFVEATASINRLLRDTAMEDFVNIDRTKPHEIIYSIVCPSGRLKPMIEKLKDEWSGFDSARLVVRAESPADRIVISEVSVDQLTEIISQNDGDRCIRAARYFAIANDMSKFPDDVDKTNLPGIANPDSMTIPKPVLTGGQNQPEPGIKTGDDGAMIRMTIVVTAEQ